jgi:uncharacterized protein (TIGR02118 family)
LLKITFLMRRLPHLSREEFQTYYRKVHTRAAGPNATDALGMRRYVQLHALPEDVNDKFGESRGGEPSFDAVAEIWLDSYEAYERDWNSEEGKKVLDLLLEDEKNFVDWSRSVIMMSKELVFIDGPSTPARAPKA